jgi:hypothetical protein
MTTPTWQAATTGQLPKADQVNQLLGTHQAQLLYTGTQRSAQNTAGSGNTNSNGLYVAQSFTTAAGQTAIGYVNLTVSTTGGFTGLAPTTVSIYTNSAGAPGVSLGSMTVTGEHVAASPAIVTYPLPVTGLTASTTYWIVVAAAGDASHFYGWHRSNQVSGASTSPNGTAWTAQTYGMLYQVYDQGVIPPLVASWEDNGARWVWFSFNGDSTLAEISEYTAGQTATGYMQSFRTLSYSNSSITTIA